MKVIFLNAWYGNTKEVLWKYLREEVKTTDIFCFMEADGKFREKCAEILSDHISISTEKAIANEDGCFQSTYMKKEYKVLKSEPILGIDPDVGLGLLAQIEKDGEVWNIANIHGVARPGDKLDNPKRIEQSQKIIEYMAKIERPKIIGGDFNLDKNTESVKMFEKNGYRNLIEEYKIDMTRNHLIWDIYPENKQFWADYLFVSPEIKVKSFEVPKNEISDHLPLVLEIEE